jgi:hypothetical protein
MNRLLIALLIVALPLVYWLGRQQAPPASTLPVVPTATPVEDPVVAQTQQWEEALLKDPKVSKATYKVAQLERFKEMPPRSLRQPVDADSPEGKARREAMLLQRTVNAKNQMLRLRSNAELLKTWNERVVAALAESEKSEPHSTSNEAPAQRLAQFVRRLKTDEIPIEGELLREYLHWSELL